MRCGPDCCREEDLPRAHVAVLGANRPERIGRMVTDVVVQSLDGGLSEIRMSEPHPRGDRRAAQLSVRGRVRERDRDAEFRKAGGILGGLWEKVRERPAEFLDRRTIEEEGLDAAARDFLAGMTDRYAISLYEQLFIPKSWV